MRVECATRLRGATAILTLFLSGCGSWLDDGDEGDGAGGGDGPSTADATLSALSVSAGEMFPAFDPATRVYVVTVDTSVEAVSVIPTPTDAGATVTVDDVEVPSGSPSTPEVLETDVPRTFDVEVAGSDGVTSLHYEIVVVRLGIVPEAYLKSLVTVDGDFGRSVAISGDVIVVGAPKEDAAYVYERAGAWAGPVRITGANTQPGDLFAWTVAIAGDRIVVGAPGEDGGGAGVDPPDDEATTDAGAAYVFVREGASWTQEARLKAANPGVQDFFGGSVAIDADTIAVGASGEDGPGTGIDPPFAEGTPSAGAVYVFVRPGGTWSQQAYVKPSVVGELFRFGWSVALSGNRLAVGAAHENGPPLLGGVVPTWEAGALYVFTRTGTTWAQEDRVQRASDAFLYQHFGWSVAISGETLVVGAPGDHWIGSGVAPERTEVADDQGAAFVYVLEGDAWVEQAYLKATWPSPTPVFGSAVAISGDLMVVGVVGDEGGGEGVNSPSGTPKAGSGAADLFARRAGSWTHVAYLKATNPGVGDEFGFAVAIDGGTIVVGAPHEDGSGTGVNPPDDDLVEHAGAAYVFR